MLPFDKSTTPLRADDALEAREPRPPAEFRDLKAGARWSRYRSLVTLQPRTQTAIILAYFSIFLLPIILATLAFPFGWWDHLSAIRLYLPYGCCTFSAILPNY